MRKYVESGADPVWLIWNGIRFASIMGRSDEEPWREIVVEDMVTRN